MSSMPFEYFLLLWALTGVVVFFVLFWVKAPYGRFARGRIISFRVGWMVMELPALVVFPLVYWWGQGFSTSFTTFFVLLWIFHYVNRTIVYPLRVRGGRGIALQVVLSAFVFNVVNGFFLGYYFGFLAPEYTGWLSDPRFWIGLFLWLAGLVINWDADNTLLAIKREGAGYQIPHRRLYAFVACPNYLGEIIEWTGFLVMTWCLPVLAFWIWVLANLVPRALAYRRWYGEQFPDYPAQRKALIPFVL